MRSVSIPEQPKERVAYLEAVQLQLLSKVEDSTASKPWWEQIAGTFADRPDYDEAMQLGREYRNSLRPDSLESIDE